MKSKNCVKILQVRVNSMNKIDPRYNTITIEYRSMLLRIKTQKYFVQTIEHWNSYNLNKQEK